MKTINKKSTIDPIAEARKDKSFSSRSKSARVAIRLAVKVYEKRKQMGWSQIDLAKQIGTTQRIVSNIESGDVDVGSGFVKKLIDGLGFSNDDLGWIFESSCWVSVKNNTVNPELVNVPQRQSIKYSTINNYFPYETNRL